jgi:hypothetical protein
VREQDEYVCGLNEARRAEYDRRVEYQCPTSSPTMAEGTGWRTALVITSITDNR